MSVELLLLIMTVALLAASIYTLGLATRWTRAMAEQELEVLQQLRLITDDVRRISPELEETLSVGLLQLDDWERRVQRVRKVSAWTLLNFRRRPPF